MRSELRKVFGVRTPISEKELYTREIQLLVLVPLPHTEFEQHTKTMCPTEKVFSWRLPCPPSQGQGSKDLALVYAEHPSPGLLLGLVYSHPHCILKHLLHAAIA